MWDLLEAWLKDESAILSKLQSFIALVPLLFKKKKKKINNPQQNCFISWAKTEIELSLKGFKVEVKAKKYQI